MRTRTLGRTEVRVTELAYGAAGIGNLFRPVADEEAAAAVDAAWDAGIRTFDTAPHYGLGLSERRLGAALRDRPRDTYTVSTKVGRLLVSADTQGDDLANGFAVPATHRRVWDFSADGVRRSLEASLDRLGPTGWTSSSSTTPTSTPNRPSTRPTRHWSGCAPKASSEPSASA